MIQLSTYGLLPCPWASFLLVVILGAWRSPLSYPPTPFACLGHSRASQIGIQISACEQLLFNPGFYSDTDVFNYLNEYEPDWIRKNVPRSCSFFTVTKWEETGSAVDISTGFLSDGGLNYHDAHMKSDQITSCCANLISELLFFIVPDRAVLIFLYQYVLEGASLCSLVLKKILTVSHISKTLCPSLPSKVRILCSLFQLAPKCSFMFVKLFNTRGNNFQAIDFQLFIIINIISIIILI